MPTRERYTHGHHESVLRTHSWRTAENSAAYLLPHLTPGISLLDVGSGPGTITVDFAERLAPGRVVGVDAAESVVEQAAGLAAEHGLTNVEFRTGDIYALDFPDDTFDVTHVHQVLQHVGDPVAALRELRRVTKPGGIVAARDVDYAGVLIHPLPDGLAKWYSTNLAVARANAGDPTAGRRLKAWAIEAGFEDVTSSASIWCFASDEEREWWGGAWAERAIRSDFAAHAKRHGLATDEDLQEMSAAWLEWVAARDGWLGMPHGEILARA
ncbi:methyltransferase domain-containing protein [Herbiconiux sp. SYSU D00978]|uniref:methyltransferase domain-containing protein n=1 Tax=Herbiconiux sp. SYSU D00978 TaxID=2812562 RepID=UPI001A970B59|nr:methyltransferase domain-containing protein [Herbiconiux sp. SYSU D00978]